MTFVKTALPQLDQFLGAAVTSWFDKHTDPIGQFNYLVKQTEEWRDELRGDLLTAVEALHVEEGVVSAQKQTLATWQRRAEQYVDKGDDTNAALAIEQKQKYEVVVKQLEEKLHASATRVETFKLKFATLNDKIGQLNAQKPLIEAEVSMAAGNEKIARVREIKNHGVDVDAALGKVYQHVNRLTARAAATEEVAALSNTTTVEQKFAQADTASAVSDELAVMKAARNKK